MARSLQEWGIQMLALKLVIPLDAPDKQKRFTVDPFYSWYIGNAFENGAQLIIDAVAYPDFDSNQALGMIPSGKKNNGGLNASSHV